MHELSLVQQIVEVAAARAGTARVLKVTVEVGRSAAVMPSSLRFCFDLAAEGTPLNGAVLELVEVPGPDLKIRSLEVT